MLKLAGTSASTLATTLQVATLRAGIGRTCELTKSIFDLAVEETGRSRYDAQRVSERRTGMTAQAINLKVTASVPKDCIFQLEGDGWNGICEELAVTVRGSSFEDAKRKMEAALQVQIEKVLRRHSGTRGKRAA
jgi:hypothetical protein